MSRIPLPWYSLETTTAPKATAAIWPGMTPDRAMNSGSKSGSEVSDTPASAENAVVAANRASSVPHSERRVSTLSASARRTGVRFMVRPPGAVR
ncbi:hypothetical protein STENM327S_04720 [Streptomyces tendae]